MRQREARSVSGSWSRSKRSDDALGEGLSEGAAKIRLTNRNPPTHGARVGLLPPVARIDRRRILRPVRLGRLPGEGAAQLAGLTGRNPVDDTFTNHDHRRVGTA